MLTVLGWIVLGVVFAVSFGVVSKRMQDEEKERI